MYDPPSSSPSIQDYIFFIVTLNCLSCPFSLNWRSLYALIFLSHLLPTLAFLFFHLSYQRLNHIMWLGTYTLLHGGYSPSLLSEMDIYFFWNGSFSLHLSTLNSLYFDTKMKDLKNVFYYPLIPQATTSFYFFLSETSKKYPKCWPYFSTPQSV